MTIKNNWRRINIKEVCSSIVDCINKTAHTVDFETDYKMLRTTNIKNGWIDVVNTRRVTEETYKKWTRRQIPQKGDVILTREAPLGEVGLLRTDDKVFLGQRLVSYRADPKKLDNKFLFYSFLSHDLVSQIESLGSGSTVKHMRVPDAEKLTILMPEIETQKKISSVIASYDDLIENNEKRIKALEEMAQLLYIEWFVKFKFPGHEKVKMVDSGTEYGVIPEGWEVKKFYDVVNNLDSRRKPISSMKRQEMKGNFPYYGAAKIIDQINNYIFDGRYLLIAEDGSVITPDGKPMLQFVDEKFWVSNHAHIVQGNLLSTEILYLRLKRLNIGPLITGSAQPKITKDNLSRVLFIVPDKSTRNLFTEIVGHFFDEVFNLQKRIKNLSKVRDLLITQLVTGKRNLK